MAVAAMVVVDAMGCHATCSMEPTDRRFAECSQPETSEDSHHVVAATGQRSGFAVAAFVDALRVFVCEPSNQRELVSLRRFFIRL